MDHLAIDGHHFLIIDLGCFWSAPVRNSNFAQTLIKNAFFQGLHFDKVCICLGFKGRDSLGDCLTYLSDDGLAVLNRVVCCL